MKISLYAYIAFCIVNGLMVIYLMAYELLNWDNRYIKKHEDQRNIIVEGKVDAGHGSA